MVMAPPPCMTQQYPLASLAAWLSSTSISHHSLFPHIPSISLSAVNSSPRPGIAPQSLNSNSQPLHLSGDQHSCLGYVWLCKDCLIFIPFTLPQINCFIHSLKCFSSDSDSCLGVGYGPLLQFPHPPGAGPVLLTLLLSPYFLHPTKFCMILYSFLLVRYSCLLSAGVLHALLFLKMYS